jgi:hypothetical protein
MDYYISCIRIKVGPARLLLMQTANANLAQYATV